jgi:putative membrane protein
MMGGTGGWVMLLWGLLALVLVIAGGIVAARVLAASHSAQPPEISGDGPPGVRQAQDALRLRYANGEISREEYLQGKVELEE